jgi:hypothetical protein
MKRQNRFQQLLSDKGLSLSRLGLRDIGLERNDALAAVELLRNSAQYILGGDVFFKHGDEVKVAYANWHSEPRESETYEEFASRSCEEAKDYIEKFPESDAMALFVLVIGAGHEFI